MGFTISQMFPFTDDTNPECVDQKYWNEGDDPSKQEGKCSPHQQRGRYIVLLISLFAWLCDLWR
jgi:hypothetical protein